MRLRWVGGHNSCFRGSVLIILEFTNGFLSDVEVRVDCKLKCFLNFSEVNHRSLSEMVYSGN